MTREEAKELLPIIQAWVEGKTLEYYNDDIGEWQVTTKAIFINPNKYRIKPESKYRPFKTQEQCWSEMLKHQPFGWVIDKVDNKYFDISMIYHFTEIKSETKVITVGKVHTLKEAFNNLTFTDGTPFGIKEE